MKSSLHSSPCRMFSPCSMYKPPYPAQNFHFVPAFPSADPQRPVVPAPLPPPPGSEIQQGPNRPPAPVYGLITDLPLPVPTADLQVRRCSPPSSSPSPHTPPTWSMLQQRSLHWVANLELLHSSELKPGLNTLNSGSWLVRREWTLASGLVLFS